MGAEGALFAMRGGAARLAVGIGYRHNEFQDRNLTNGTTNADNGDSSRFTYAELSFPFISPDSHAAVAHRLELSAALRGEDYKSFGKVTTPKIGLVYGPSADFTLRASWGKSFKAPTLLQRYGTYYTYLYPAWALGGASYGSDAVVLMPYGGNPDLKPERARTWSASLAFHPEAIPGMQAELTWFSINYTDRVVLPIGGGAETLSNPIYAQFIEYYPTAKKQQDTIAGSKFSNWSGADYDPAKVIAIASNRYTNASWQQVEGIDLIGSYQFDLGKGRLTMRGSASWLQSTQRTTEIQDAYDLAGTLFNPPKFNSRLGIVWSEGGFTASSFVSYISGVRNAIDQKQAASFTTFDTTFRYELDGRGNMSSGLAFELSMQNLFNRNPPLYTPSAPESVRYDSTNYSAIGRFVSFSISKHF